MVKATEKMQSISEVQYSSRNFGEYILALKATMQRGKPIFLQKYKNDDGGYYYSVGNKDNGCNKETHQDLDSAIEDLNHFISNKDFDEVTEAINRIEKQVKGPEGLKVYNLNDF